MKESLNENKSLFILLGVLAFVVLGALYYYIILPKSDAKTRVSGSIELLKSETNQLQQEIITLSVVEEEPVEDYELRKKLPEKREINTLLLSLQEVELVSEAKIMAISFNDYDGLVSESNIEPTTEEDLEEEETTESSESEEGEENVEEDVDLDIPQTQINIESLPEQLKLLSLNVEIVVQDYEHLLTFIKEVESIERVIRIDNISFSQIGEEGFAEEDLDESIVVTIQLTTFYSEEVGS